MRLLEANGAPLVLGSTASMVRDDPSLESDDPDDERQRPAHARVGDVARPEVVGARVGADRTGYRIGMRLWELGTLAARGGTLREVALPFMQDLY